MIGAAWMTGANVFSGFITTTAFTLIKSPWSIVSQIDDIWINQILDIECLCADYGSCSMASDKGHFCFASSWYPHCPSRLDSDFSITYRNIFQLTLVATSCWAFQKYCRGHPTCITVATRQSPLLIIMVANSSNLLQAAFSLLDELSKSLSSTVGTISDDRIW